MPFSHKFIAYNFPSMQFGEFSKLIANKYCHKKLGNHLGSDINYRRQLGALLQTFSL